MATKLYSTPTAGMSNKVQAYGGDVISPASLQKQPRSKPSPHQLQQSPGSAGSNHNGMGTHIPQQQHQQQQQMLRQSSVKVVGPTVDLVSSPPNSPGIVVSTSLDYHSNDESHHQHPSSSSRNGSAHHQYQPTPPNSLSAQKSQQRQQQQQMHYQPQNGPVQSHQQHQQTQQQQQQPSQQMIQQPQKVLRYEDCRMEIGLENLGNTCFMNSALQCLLHIQPLVQYFLEGKHEHDLNTASPKKGMLAKSFHGLIHEVMNGRTGSAIAPVNFQRAVGIFAPYLMDYQQQDSQEFLRFLLDGMSDDLLRRKSPQKSSSQSEKLQITDVSSPHTGNSRSSSIFSPQTNSSNNNVKSPQNSTTLPDVSQLNLASKHEAVPQSSPQDHPKHPPTKAQKLRSETLAMRENHQLEEDYYVLSDDEETDRLATTGIAANSKRETGGEQINHSKLRVIKNIAKARELEATVSLQHPSSVDIQEENKSPVAINVVPSSPAPASSSVSVVSTPQSKSTSYTATLSNTFRRMRGRTNSELEDQGTTVDDLPLDNVNSIHIVSDPKDISTVEKEACEAWERYLKLNDSVITDIFGGLLQSTVQCCTCNHRSFAFDPFLDLSIPIFKEGEAPSSSRGLFPSLTLRSGNNHAENKSTLEKCLEKFTAEEVLDGENMYHCEKCKKNRKSIKKLSIFRYPRVLVVHIKRFRFSTTSREKLSTDVHFPLSGLDLKPYLSSDLQYIRQAPNIFFRSLSISMRSNNNNHDEEESNGQPDSMDKVIPFSPTPSPPKTQKKPSSQSSIVDNSEQQPAATKTYDAKSLIHNHCEPLYDLISVSNHHGSLNGGHYIAHVDTNYGKKSERNPRWMCFNDARVSNANATSIAGPTAYVLFYRLREDSNSYYDRNSSGRLAGGEDGDKNS